MVIKAPHQTSRPPGDSARSFGTNSVTELSEQKQIVLTDITTKNHQTSSLTYFIFPTNLIDQN